MKGIFLKYARYIVGAIALVAGILIFLYDLETGQYFKGALTAIAAGAVIALAFNTVACSIGTEKISRHTFLEIISWLSPY